MKTFCDNLFDRYRDFGLGTDEPAREHLMPLFGDSLLEVLCHASPACKRVVVKTPDIHGIDHFDRFFPVHKPVVTLRDGRSVVGIGKAPRYVFVVFFADWIPR